MKQAKTKSPTINIGITAAHRKKIAEGLSALLADCSRENRVDAS